MNIESITNKTVQLIEESAQYVRSERSKWKLEDLMHKEDTTLVTSIDQGVEKRLVDELTKLLPGSTFIAEEFHSEAIDSPLRWILDPVDGTTNLVHNIPAYCISLALQVDREIVIGIVYEINRSECFWTHKDMDGAFLNKKPIKVSKQKDLRHSVLATGYPPSEFEHFDEYVDQLKSLMKNTRAIRRLGSAALDLAYVASGVFDGFFEYHLKAWDVAAGSYLVQKCGGKVTDFYVEDDYIFGKQMLASNGMIHDQLLEYFKNLKRNE